MQQDQDPGIDVVDLDPDLAPVSAEAVLDDCDMSEPPMRIDSNRPPTRFLSRRHTRNPPGGNNKYGSRSHRGRAGRSDGQAPTRPSPSTGGRLHRRIPPDTLNPTTHRTHRQDSRPGCQPGLHNYQRSSTWHQKVGYTREWRTRKPPQGCNEHSTYRRHPPRTPRPPTNHHLVEDLTGRLSHHHPRRSQIDQRSRTPHHDYLIDSNDLPR